MNLMLWAKEQFTKERMVRYLDGCNPGIRSGYDSFIQFIDWGHEAPHLWSCVNVRCPDGKRARYYLHVRFYNSQVKDYAAVLDIRCRGKESSKTIHFGAEENAPKKLNKAIRLLRQENHLKGI